MPRTKKLYEVVVLMTGKQIKELRKHFPATWRVTRKVIEWYVTNADQMPNTGLPVKDIIQDGEDLYILPEDGYGVPGWRVTPFMSKIYPRRKR